MTVGTEEIKQDNTCILASKSGLVNIVGNMVKPYLFRSVRVQSAPITADAGGRLRGRFWLKLHWSLEANRPCIGFLRGRLEALK
ncbi:hypothetical protein LIER_03097 [Lithospermum erythrorhizon]|uniref:Uncharacterized protein n=1 Tax=Lithospermum erythrorhizon TaxID=34254 RepID=A0AAV3NUN8_LITER